MILRVFSKIRNYMSKLQKEFKNPHKQGMQIRKKLQDLRDKVHKEVEIREKV